MALTPSPPPVHCRFLSPRRQWRGRKSHARLSECRSCVVSSCSALSSVNRNMTVHKVQTSRCNLSQRVISHHAGARAARQPHLLSSDDLINGPELNMAEGLKKSLGDVRRKSIALNAHQALNTKNMRTYFIKRVLDTPLSMTANVSNLLGFFL